MVSSCQALSTLRRDMSSQVLCTFVVYTCQSLCVLKRSSRSRPSCSWRAYIDGMLVNFALLFSSSDLVSKFMQQNWLLTAVATAHGSSVATVGAVSAFLVERCGRCTRWQTAGGPGAVYKYWAGTGGLSPRRGAGRWVIAGTWPPPGVSMASRLLLVCSCSPGSLP